MAISFPNFKACLSSRPWVIFQEALLHDPSLQLEDLTYPDIIAYVECHFNTNSGFTALGRRDPKFAASLTENIAKKSSGVFLWVNPVVRSLLSGLSNFDRISDLQRRLDELPSDLEHFFQRIFDSIDPFYAEQANQMFRIVDIAEGKLTALGLCFADEDEDPETMQFVLDFPVRPLSAEEKEDMYEQAKRRLNTCCKGFLEVPNADYEAAVASYSSNSSIRLDDVLSLPSPPHRLPIPSSYSSSNHYPTPLNTSPPYATSQPPPSPSPPPHLRKVTYLHRTVRDFLKSAQIDEKIRSNAGSFDSTLSLLQSNMLMVKVWEFGYGKHHSLPDLEDIMKYAVLVEKSRKLNHAFLDELERVMTSHFESDKRCVEANKTSSIRHWAAACGPIGRKPPDTFLELAAMYELQSYVAAKISQKGTVFLDQDERPILDRIVTQYEDYLAFREPKFYEKLKPIPSLGLIDVG
ncbi:hypothetical protein G7Z17_g2295 [Cylindrodendrum hubeiense]|uniref:DUF7791 domain-containing protein n=1 Tax=Cylindrodendrum hubeiense TaxID=595255 RepID=A0A9P5LBS9_9HYPO|nr:hypothetical protein G7Z17_g2295 [Cylindrodendrum hubeiense]